MTFTGWQVFVIVYTCGMIQAFVALRIGLKVNPRLEIAPASWIYGIVFWPFSLLAAWWKLRP